MSPTTSTPIESANENLTPPARAALALTDEERIQWLRKSRWIGYTRATEILDKLDDLMTYPKKHRMPNLLIVGDTNNGKTMIVNRFHRAHKARENPGGEGITLPVLAVQAPPVPDEARFYNGILDKLFASYRASDRVDKKQFQTIQLLTRMNTQMLVIDEIHHIIAGNATKQRHFLNTIKYLGNELQIPIVGVGTKDAFNAIQTDPQLSNRFEPAILPRWKMNDEYLSLLASYEMVLPLRQPSELTEDELAMKLLSMSEGVIGELAAILSSAAILAIKKRTERITLKMVESVKFIQPSERKWKTS